MNIYKRDESIDIIKGIGILLVLIGHTTDYGRKFIYQFHMPLFFFISGILYKDKYDIKPIKLIERRIKSLYIPFVTYNLFFLFMHNIFINIGVYEDSKYYSLKEIVSRGINILLLSASEPLTGPLWFVSALFVTNIIFVLYKYFTNKFFYKFKEEFLLLLIILTLIVGINTDIKRGVSIGMVGLLFYYLGYLYKRNYNKIITQFKLSFAIWALIIVVIISRFNQIEMAINNYGNKGLFLVSSILGIYVMFFVGNLFNEKCIGRLFISIGKYNMSIVALHFIAFKSITLLQIYIYKLPIKLLGSFPILYSGHAWWIGYIISGITIPIIIGFIINKINYRITMLVKEIVIL